MKQEGDDFNSQISNHQEQQSLPKFTTARFGDGGCFDQLQTLEQTESSSQNIMSPSRVILNYNLRSQQQQPPTSQSFVNSRRSSRQNARILSGSGDQLGVGLNALHIENSNKNQVGLSSASSSCRPRLASQNMQFIQSQPLSQPSSKAQSRKRLNQPQLVVSGMSNMPKSVSLHHSLIKSPPQSSSSSKVTNFQPHLYQPSYTSESRGNIVFSGVNSRRSTAASYGHLRNLHPCSTTHQYHDHQFFNGEGVSSSGRIQQARDATERMKKQQHLSAQFDHAQISSSKFTHCEPSCLNFSSSFGGSQQKSSINHQRVISENVTSYLENPAFLETSSFSSHIRNYQPTNAVNKEDIQGKTASENDTQNIYRTIGEKNYKSGQYEINKVEAIGIFGAYTRSSSIEKKPVRKQQQSGGGSLADFSALSLSNKITFIRHKKQTIMPSVLSESQILQSNSQFLSPVRGAQQDQHSIESLNLVKLQSMKQPDKPINSYGAPLLSPQSLAALTKHPQSPTDRDYLQPQILLSPQNHFSPQSTAQIKPFFHQQRLQTLNDQYVQRVMSTMHTTEEGPIIDKRANSQGECQGFVRKHLKRPRGIAQKIILPKNSSFLSISGILGNNLNPTSENSFLSDQKRQIGEITAAVEEPFRDLTEAHANKLNQKIVINGDNSQQTVNFNVSFGSFPKFSQKHTASKTQAMNSPIGIKAGLEMISSHKKKHYLSKENFIQFNSPQGYDPIPYGKQDQQSTEQKILQNTPIQEYHAYQSQNIDPIDSFILTSPGQNNASMINSRQIFKFKHHNEGLFAQENSLPSQLMCSPPQSQMAKMNPSAPITTERAAENINNQLTNFDEQRKILKTPCFNNNSTTKHQRKHINDSNKAKENSQLFTTQQSKRIY